jgi:nitroreductase
MSAAATSAERAGLFSALYSMRALRRFRPDPVPAPVLFQLFDAAIRAPSGQNAQDWRFIVVTERQTKTRLQEWALAAWPGLAARYTARPGGIDALSRSQKLSLRSVEHLARHLAEVPVVVVVCGLRGRHSTPGGSIFPAVQNLLLAARALGLGASIFNLPLAGGAELGTLLEIPESNQIHCLVPLGYPRDRFGPVRRKPVRDVVFVERFGRRWSFAEEQPEEGWQERWLER